MNRNIAINFNGIDDLQMGIDVLHCGGQGVFENTIEILNSVIGICEDVPLEVLDKNLSLSVIKLINILDNYPCMNTGKNIVHCITNLVEKIYKIDEMHANNISKNCKIYFGKQGCQMPWAGAGRLFINDVDGSLVDGQIYDIKQKNNIQQAKKEIAYEYIKENIINDVDCRIDISSLSQKDIYLIYGNDMINYLDKSNWIIQVISNTSGLPSNISDLLNHKLQDKMGTRKNIYEQASQLRTQLLSINNSQYTWDCNFITRENSIKLIDIFNRNNVSGEEQKANFLAQIYKESKGGTKMRETLFECDEGNQLTDKFDQKLSVQYVLKHAQYYLSDKEFNLFLCNGNNEKGFIKAISSGSNFYYKGNELGNNGEIRRGQELSDYIGQGVDNPFQISDLILYRGGGCLQITSKENYYRFAYFVEKEFEDIEAAQDIRDNGCYSKFITDKYYLETAEWYYFNGPKKIELGDSFNDITKKVHGGDDPDRNEIREELLHALETGQ